MKKKCWCFIQNKQGVTSIIGTMLLLAIAITLFSTVYYFVLTMNVTPATPAVNIVGEITDDNEIILTHFGGGSIEDSNSILVNIKGSITYIRVSNYLDDANNNSKWDLGESITYRPSSIENNSQIEFTLVDKNSNSIAVTSTLQRGNSILEPYVFTDSASKITTNSAELRLTYNLRDYEGTVHFEYKKNWNDEWNKTTPKAQSGAGSYSYPLTSLDANSNYLCRANMTIDEGKTIQGNTVTFHTEKLTIQTEIEDISFSMSNPHSIKLSALSNGNVKPENISLFYRWSNNNFEESGLFEDTFNDESLDSRWNTADNDNLDGTDFVESNGNLIIIADGSDTWTSSDEYGAVYLHGEEEDFVATTKVVSQEDTNNWAKSGIVIRNDVSDAGSATGYVFLAATQNNGVAFQYDSNNNGYLNKNTDTGNSQFPVWLKLKREGNEITGFYSHDLSNNGWTEIKSVTMNSLDSLVDVGLQHTSHNGGSLGNASFEYFNITDSSFGWSGLSTDWINWVNVNNPDLSSPWEWDFDFPNGNGFYEFYSIGQNESVDIETPPLTSDAAIFISEDSFSSNNSGNYTGGQLGEGGKAFGIDYTTDSGIYVVAYALGLRNDSDAYWKLTHPIPAETNQYSQIVVKYGWRATRFQNNKDYWTFDYYNESTDQWENISEYKEGTHFEANGNTVYENTSIEWMNLSSGFDFSNQFNIRFVCHAQEYSDYQLWLDNIYVIAVRK